MKKLISLLISSTLIFSMAVPAFASETPSTKTVQSIIASVNQEYGTQFYIPDNKQSKEATSKAGFNDISEEQIRSANLSPTELAQFEKELRESAKFISKESAKSKAAWANAVTKADKESSINANISIASDGIRLPKDGKKTITGAIAKFEGWANNYRGYWIWEYLNTASADMDYNNAKYRFTFEDYDYKIIDTGRTCAVNYKGTLHTLTGPFWVPSKSTQQVEWWAGM